MTVPRRRDWHRHWTQMPAGQYYPWKCSLPPNNGEDTYFALVKEHLSRAEDVLEAGCGYGRDALEIAPLCRSLVAYDRLPAGIDWAKGAAHELNIRNAAFVCTDSSARANGGRVAIPAQPDQFDLLVSRRGPTNWLEDASRVARPGARLIQLNPMAQPIPPWNGDLPAPLRFPAPAPDTIRKRIEGRLSVGGLRLDSCWTFDVPALFDDPGEFYLYRTFGMDEAPPFAQVQHVLEQIFAARATASGLAVGYRRFLWQAIVD